MLNQTLTFSGVHLENQALSGLIEPEIARCLSEPDALNGIDVTTFEAAVASAADRRHAVAVGSCTDALFFALIAAGIGPGDEVLVPAFSFVATASAVLRTGARLVFVDVHNAAPSAQAAPFTMDLSCAREALTSCTRAVVWVGLFGGLADPVPITHFANEAGLMLFEDAAQSFGSRYANHHGGKLGLAGAFSFDRQKVLAGPGTGGAVVTDDDALAKFVRSLRWHGRGNAGAQLGYNSQLSNLSAAILNLKLGQLPAWIKRRQQIAAYYDQALGSLQLTVPRWPDEVAHARHKYVILSEDRNKLEKHLMRMGVPTKRHYEKTLPAEPLFSKTWSSECFPFAQSIVESALSLPIHPFLSDQDVMDVVTAIEEFFA